MDLNNSCLAAAITSLTLLTGTVAPVLSATPIQGGYEADGFPLYVCFASYKGGLHPGKVTRGPGLYDRYCSIGYGGSEVRIFPFNFLYQDPRYTGSYYARPDQLPANPKLPAVRDGNGTVMYFCRMPWGGGLHPGKVVNRNCNIGYGGQEIISPYPLYRILGWTR